MLLEAAALAAVGLALAALIMIIGTDSRRQGRLGEDLSKLRQIAAWTASYTGDNSDRYWTLSWQKGAMLSQYPDLNAQAQASDSEAAAAQAVDILRRVAGREDIMPMTAWIAPIAYSHLPLEDYLKCEMPELAFVSAGDANRLRWARDPGGFDQGFYQPAPSPGTNAGKRNPYGSSFQLTTSFYDQSSVANRISQSGLHSTYTIPGAASLAGQLASGVAFPSQKVHLHDAGAWHFGRMSHVAIPEMRSPLLFTDGSVQVRAAADANPGWQPIQPAFAIPTQYSYTPQSWEPPTLNGGPAQQVLAGRFRWTRGFLAGRDFGGPEACTGQITLPACPP